MIDRLGAARRVLRAAAGVSLASLALLVLRSALPAGRSGDPRPALARSLGAAGLGLLPAGQPLREPEVLDPALDPRHCPELPAALEPALAAPPGR